MREQHTPLRAADIEQALVLEAPVRMVLKRMCDKELLRRVAPGVSEVADE